MSFKSVTIPEGAVTRISEGSNVLWEKPVEKGYNITLSGLTLPDGTSAYGFELASNSVVPNPNKNTYDGVYRSLNYNIHSSTAAMRIDFRGYPEFTVYIRSYAESSYDYIVASTLDAPEISLSYYTDRTRNIQKSGTVIASYTEVKYPNDGGEHHIYLFYRKNATTHKNLDRGFVLIKK